MENKFSFLSSNRFWALVIGAASTVLIDPNLPLQEWYITLGKFLGIIATGFIAIKTVDRNSGDAKVQAAAIQTDGASVLDEPPASEVVKTKRVSKRVSKR